jgi:hypothetical protein
MAAATHDLASNSGELNRRIFALYIFLFFVFFVSILRFLFDFRPPLYVSFLSGCRWWAGRWWRALACFASSASQARCYASGATTLPSLEPTIPPGMAPRPWPPPTRPW